MLYALTVRYPYEGNILVEEPDAEIRIRLLDALERRYQIRRTGRNGASFEVTVPPEVLVREARRLGVPDEKIADALQVVWRYNDFRGVHMEITKKEDKQRASKHEVER